MASDPTQTFTLRLNDQTSGPAKAATSALAALKTQIERDTKGIREMQAALNRLKGATIPNAEAVRRLRDQIAASKSAVAGAQARFVQLGGTFGELEPPTSRLDAFIASARDAPGPLGVIARHVGRLGTMSPAVLLTSALAVGMLALAAGAVAAASAIAALTVSVIRYGIASADARRNEALHIEGLTRLRSSARFAAMSSGAIVGAIDRVSGVAAISRSEVSGYAESLYRLGVRGDALDQSLEAVSIAAAAGGDAAGRRFLGLAAGAARAGRSVTRVVEEARARFGSVNARLNAGLDRQAERFREAMSAIFGGPRVAAAMERFLTRLGRVTSIFSQANAGGRALRTVVEALFPNLLDDAGSGLEAVRRLFLQGIIFATRATTVFVRARTALRSFARTELGRNFAALIPFLLSTASAVQDVNAWIGLLSATVRMGSAAWAAFVGMIGNASLLFSSVDWSALGGSIADGLVRGITGGREAVAGAIRGLALDAQSALEEALGIHSPSRVFAAYGVDVAGGLAEGVDAGAPEAERAVSELVEPPAGAPGRDAPGGSGSTVTIHELHVHARTDDPRGLADAFAEQLAEVLEGRVLVLGGG